MVNACKKSGKSYYWSQVTTVFIRRSTKSIHSQALWHTVEVESQPLYVMSLCKLAIRSPMLATGLKATFSTTSPYHPSTTVQACNASLPRVRVNVTLLYHAELGSVAILWWLGIWTLFKMLHITELWIFNMLYLSNPVLPQNKHDPTNHILEDQWMECCLGVPHRAS